MVFCKSFKEKSPIIRFLNEFQNSVWYPILFAVLCIFSGTHNYKVYLPILCVLCVFVLYSVVFADDNKVFLPPLLMIYFAVGFDNPPSDFKTSNGDMFASFDKKALICLIVMAAAIVIPFFVRIILDGSVKAAFTKRRKLTIGILALNLAFLLNGFMGPSFEAKNLLHGAIMGFGMSALYFVVHGILDRSTDVVPYACKTVVCASYVVLGQILFTFLEKYFDGTLFYKYTESVIDRSKLSLGWGVTTVVGATLVLGIPAAFYLARNCKFGAFSYVSGVFFAVGTFVLDSRSSMVAGCAALALCMLLSCIRSKNKVLCRVYTVLILLVPVGILFYIFNYTDFKDTHVWDLVRSVLDSHKGDSGRIELWKNGIEDFKNYPVFGIGFLDGGYTTPEMNVYSNMYHCVIIELLGAMGVFGAVAFLIHVFEAVVLTFKKFRIDKFILMLVPTMIIIMSLVDNFFFYFNIQIFYCVFLVLAEKFEEENRII